jgi:hypothetical protein
LEKLMTERRIVYQPYNLPKDVGVALVVLLALGLGWLLFMQTEGSVRVFQAADTPFRMSVPAAWSDAPSLQDALLKVEDWQTASPFKTTLTVERRELESQSPPTLQTLLDRRVTQRGALTGYHFLSDGDATVGGAKAKQLEYAYVTQPIDEARRASLPVVVHAREYIVVTQDRTYYITLAAPEDEFERASARFDQMIASVQLS